jgi:hypothetical protein
MIDAELDDHLLSYNCFGFAIIRADGITVSVNAYKYGRPYGRTLEHELGTKEVKLERVEQPVLLPWAAWVTETEIQLAAGRMEDYDAEMFVINKEIIERVIKAAIATIRGTLLSR